MGCSWSLGMGSFISHSIMEGVRKSGAAVAAAAWGKSECMSNAQTICGRLHQSHLHPRRSLGVGSAVMKALLYVFYTDGNIQMNWMLCPLKLNNTLYCRWFLKLLSVESGEMPKLLKCLSHKHADPSSIPSSYYKSFVWWCMLNPGDGEVQNHRSHWETLSHK